MSASCRMRSPVRSPPGATPIMTSGMEIRTATTRRTSASRRLCVLSDSPMIWPTDIRQEFEPARTVRTGKPKFRLLLGEEVR